MTERLDVTDTSAITRLLTRAAESLGGPDTLVFVAGQLPDQAEVNRDPSRLRETMEVNAISAMVVLNEGDTIELL